MQRENLMSNTTSMDDLYLSLHGSARSAEGGISGVARRLGKREGTLIGKLDPKDDLHQPNIGEFVQMMMDTGDTMPLEIMCALFGGQFVTRNVKCSSTVMMAVLHAVNECADVPKALEKALANDEKIDDGERLEILREVVEAKGGLIALENTLRSGVES